MKWHCMAKTLHNGVEETSISQIVHRVGDSACNAHLLDSFTGWLALLGEKVHNFAIFNRFKCACVAAQGLWRQTFVSLISISILLPICNRPLIVWTVIIVIDFSFHGRGAEAIALAALLLLLPAMVLTTLRLRWSWESTLRSWLPKTVVVAASLKAIIALLLASWKIIHSIASHFFIYLAIDCFRLLAFVLILTDSWNIYFTYDC